MMVVSLASTILLAVMLAVALWNLAAARRLEAAGDPSSHPVVSILVPARNEEANLRALLPALLRLDYPKLEILVLDDGSDDDTAAVVQEHASIGGARLRLLPGRPPPPGWMGKSWACHQLAAAASGEVLVFCDADVLPLPTALERTIAAMQSANAGAATVIPRHQLDGWIESAVVPLVAQLPVLALLPLALVPRVRAPSLSMANGQWLAFTRAAYAACGGHAGVRETVLEDVALGRRVKEAGHRLLPLVSHSMVSVRMYRDPTALWEGFGKNVYALAGGRPAPFVAALAVFGIVAIYPWLGVALGVRGALVPLALLAAVRACGVLLFRHGIRSALLHPAGSILLTAIALKSYVGTRRGTMEWKGRRIGEAGARMRSAA
ncbi:glycosyltransferase family 2 protein [Longimicrobium sp.]|jgi:chlorobactene glucosyltransferase|uniref:glycosyltransferase n=1 Tax=Longimicrobium sp. TaxID=2029185 RepID=UPI002ED8B094